MSLAGTYTGTMNEASELNRAVRLMLEPNGSFELVAGDASGRPGRWRWPRTAPSRAATAR